jgi:hypothetical protein
LFLAILAIQFRARQRWAWWTCWALLIAYLGYTLTFGANDPAIVPRSLIGTIGAAGAATGVRSAILPPHPNSLKPSRCLPA